MDPHSRRSQFNQRTPKTGPLQTVRFMDPHPVITLEKLKQTASNPSPKSPSNAPALFTNRPIATNSRVKQDEQYRKDMYLAFVNNALNQKLSGRSEAFDELVDQFNLKKISGDGVVSTAQLRFWILALSHVLSRLERRHAALVEAIVNVPWATMDNAFVKSYTVFIGMLLSARPEYLTLVLGKIAQGLTHQSGLQALNAGVPESSSRPLTRRIVYERLHYMLRYLLTLIPTLPSTLQPLLIRNFPHKRQPHVAQVTYIRNLLQVTEYCPELSDRILATIIDRAIQIDVEIQVELEELEDDDAPDHADVFELDPFDTVVGQDGEESISDADEEDGADGFSDLSSDEGDGDSVGGPETSTDMNHIHSMVNKLDGILNLIFEHFDRIHSSAEAPVLSPLSPSLPGLDSLPLISESSEPVRPLSPLSTESSKALRRAQFHTLLSIFDRTVIRTFKSRYTQFIIFWYSSLDPEFSDLFQGMLVQKALLEKDQPAVTRAAAASYIGSFVSRAQFVDREGTRTMTSVLCNFLRSHLDAFDAILQSEQSSPSMSYHSIFYAVAQAVFLIFCFRWRDLQELEEDVDESLLAMNPAKKWMPELSVLQRVVTSPLNPLKVCSSNVVMQFARVAQATDFVYCYSILEANKRSEYRSGVRQRGSIDAELNTFFPFDPYKLPRSSSYIQGVYREWTSVAIDDDEDEEEEEEEEEEDMISGNSRGVEEGPEAVEGVPPMSQELQIPRSEGRGEAFVGDDGLGESFGGMSISPAQPRIIAAVS